MNIKLTNYNLKQSKAILCILLLIVMSMTISCEKYVDIRRNSSQGLIETVRDAQLLLDSYNIMNIEYASDAQLSADDFFISGQTFNSGSVEDQGIFTWQDVPRANAAPNWQNQYQIVYRANLALETIEKIRSTSTNKTEVDIIAENNVRGAGLFFRAYSFWNIAQLYADPYNADNLDRPGIPLRLVSDINIKSIRSTVKQTYDKIIQDLQEAAVLLPDIAIVVSRPSKVAAYAMLARVYLSMGSYSEALNYANEALKIKSTLMDFNLLTGSQLSSNTPFARFNIEVIFHSQTSSTTYLNPGVVNNPIARIDPILVSSYESNDLRKIVFLKPNNITLNYINSSGGSSSASVPDFTYRFTGNYEQTSNAAQFNGLAVDELYLISAECYARLGNRESAIKNLNILLKNRYVNTTTNPYVEINVNTDDRALDLILEHRRKELVMRSQRWTDLRRLNKEPKYRKDILRNISDINAVGTSPSNYNIVYTPRASFVLPANDKKYTLLIPQEVISNSEIQQNNR